MSRYIDVDSLTQHIKDKLGISSFDYLLDSEKAIVNVIESEPSIDIVRCRECKYAYMTYNDECKYCEVWRDDDGNYEVLYLNGDYFCADGERICSEKPNNSTTEQSSDVRKE